MGIYKYKGRLTPPTKFNFNFSRMLFRAGLIIGTAWILWEKWYLGLTSVLCFIMAYTLLSISNRKVGW